ncbi:MAG: two-component regulator propeller domain-containing protein, partial [Bacteroidota bacterium]
MNKISFLFFSLFLVLTGNILKSQTFTNYTVADGLPDNFINGGVAVDSDNNKWFGTAAGIAKFNDTTWTVYSTFDGLIDNYTTCIASDGNDIWIGTNLGASKFDGTTWTSYTTTEGLPDNTINYIAADQSGNIWFATFAGATKFNGSVWTNYTTSDGLPSDLISYITTDGFGNIWFGTWMGGIAKYNGSTFTSYNMANTDSLLDDNISSIAITQTGEIWIGTLYGITVLDNAGNWVINYRQTDGLYNDYIMDIDIDLDGSIWSGSFIDYLLEGGVTEFDGYNWASYDVSDGMADAQIERLAVDQDNNIWVATGTGVTKISQITSVSNIQKDLSILVFPNPVKDLLYVPDNVTANVKIIDISGNILIDKNMQGCNQQIDISRLSAGVYFINFQRYEKTCNFK